MGFFWNMRTFSVVLTSALFYCLSSLYAFLSSLCSLLLLRRLVGAGCLLAADHCAVNICSRVFTLTRTNVLMERMLLQWYIYNGYIFNSPKSCLHVWSVWMCKISKGKLIFSHLCLCFEAAGWCQPLCKKYARSPVPAWFLSDSPEICMLGVFVIVKCCRCEAE